MQDAIWNPLFEGYYGMQNTGDDVFCAIAAWGAGHYWQADRAGFSTSRLPIMPASIDDLNALAIFQGKLRFSGYIFSLLALIYRKQHLGGASGVVYAGGSTLLDIPHAKRLFQQISRRLTKPMGGIGLSIGPFRNERDERRVVEFLQNLAFLTLRDETSHQLAQNMDLPYKPVKAFDLAGLLPSVYGMSVKDRATSELPLLGLGLGHHGEYNAVKEKRIQEALIHLAKRKKLKMRFCIFNGHPIYGDADLTQRMVAALEPFCPVEIKSYTQDPGEMWRYVAECDAFLAERLHSAIFAYMARVPFAFIEYHRKCTDLADDIGLPETCRIPKAAPDVMLITNALLNLLSAPQFATLSLDEAQARAALNFTAAPWCVTQHEKGE